MSYGIRVVGFIGKVRTESTRPNPLSWVKEYDPDAHNGGGFVDFTDDPSEALQFDTSEEAWDCWRSQSTVMPLRADGGPNRPLTAITILVEEIS